MFWSYRRDVSDKASQYIQGLLTKGIRKNAEDIAEVVPGAKTQNLQQFISDSKWQYTPVLQHTALNVNELIGDENDTGFFVDESGIPKKGKMSVGVARQWLGCLGKTDNGQVGVYSALGNGTIANLINAKLYLPEEWIKDKERCKKAHIPEEHQVFKTKDELALELVDEAVELKLKFGWVGADAGYGKGLNFMRELENRNLTFMIDVHKDQKIYLTKPKPYIPVKEKECGRPATEFVVDEKTIRIDKLIETINDSKWRIVEVRDSTKGPVLYEVFAKRVYCWTPYMKDEIKSWWLVVRRNPITHDDYKYSISNSTVDTTIERLAYMQGQRYWIEHAFEICKGDCGMADYEVRGWDGWHRHMALVMMAQYFLSLEMIDNKNEIPLLSPRDIMEILAIFLPKKEVTIESVIREMQLRHIQREKTKQSGIAKVNEFKQSILT